MEKTEKHTGWLEGKPGGHLSHAWTRLDGSAQRGRLVEACVDPVSVTTVTIYVSAHHLAGIGLLDTIGVELDVGEDTDLRRAESENSIKKRFGFSIPNLLPTSWLSAKHISSMFSQSDWCEENSLKDYLHVLLSDIDSWYAALYIGSHQ